MEAIFTEDIDVIILVDSDEEYLRTFRRVGESAEGQDGVHHIIGGIPVQMFPSNTKPLFSIGTLSRKRQIAHIEFDAQRRHDEAAQPTETV